MGSSKKPPFSFPPLTLPAVDPEYDVTVEATPGTVEGQLWALFESGVAQLPLKQDLVPANLPLVLTTDTLELFAPALKQQWPGRPVQVMVSARSVPAVQLTTEGMGVSMDAELTFQVVQSDGSTVDAFSVGCPLTAMGKVQLKVGGDGVRMVPEVVRSHCAATMHKAHVAGLRPKYILRFVSNLISVAAGPMTRVLFGQGMPLSAVPGVTLEGGHVTQLDGFVKASFTAQIDGVKLANATGMLPDPTKPIPPPAQRFMDLAAAQLRAA